SIVKHVFLAAATFCVVTTATAATHERVGDFSLLDQQGYFHQLSYYDDHKAVALLVQSTGSKATAAQIEAFKAAKAKYREVEFFMINPTGSDSRASVQQDVDRFATDIPVLMDDARLVSQGLGIDRTGEVLLVHPGTTDVLYRGPAGKPLEAAI